MYENAAPCPRGKQEKYGQNSVLSDSSSDCSFMVDDHVFLPKKIFGPLITICNCAAGATQTAETALMR